MVSGSLLYLGTALYWVIERGGCFNNRKIRFEGEVLRLLDIQKRGIIEAEEATLSLRKIYSGH